MQTPRRNLVPIALIAMFLGGCGVWSVEKRALSSNSHIRTSALKNIRMMRTERRQKVIAAMLEMISSDDDRLSNRAAEALVTCGPAAVDPLMEKLSVEDPYTRTLAVTILGEIGAPVQKVGPALVSALEDTHPLVREEAARALFRMGPNAMGAVPALLMTLSDTDPGVRDAARAALRRLGVKDIEPPKRPSKTG